MDSNLAKKKLLEQERVTVRIWTSGFNVTSPGESVGHVSVETDNTYMSLWPKQANHSHPSAKDREGKGVVSPISSEFVPSYENDVDYEGREPEHTIRFYT